MHGKRSTLQVVEFAEQVFFYLPKRSRAKLSPRWQIGSYLGLANSPNEHFIATRQSNVFRSRSVVRVVEASRWNLDAALGVTGTPAAPQPQGMSDSFAAIEKSAEPHLDLDADLIREIEGDDAEPPAPPENPATAKQYALGKIMEKDIRTYGSTDDCPRCQDMSNGRHKSQHGRTISFRHHTDACRAAGKNIRIPNMSSLDISLNRTLMSPNLLTLILMIYRKSKCSWTRWKSSNADWSSYFFHASTLSCRSARDSNS